MAAQKITAGHTNHFIIIFWIPVHFTFRIYHFYRKNFYRLLLCGQLVNITTLTLGTRIQEDG